MSGFECEFVEEPAQYLQSRCPICLLILREPFQVTCCGKNFCRQCIQRIKARDWPCPTCNEARCDIFHNKGLQQPLYGFHVFCSNKESGCDWQGELGQLDQHLNLSPDEDKLSVGCAYAEVKCLYCSELRPRHEIEHHQTSECAERPFTCSLCEEYESTYADVITNHSPMCKCRPVECPNSCGTNNLQHQHLEEHVSTQCFLSYVECEFSDAGCDAKVYRKDPSHLGENMVTHMSLLARENRKLKLQLKEQSVHLKEQSIQLKEQSVQIEELEKKTQLQHTKITSFEEALKSEINYRSAPIDLCSDLSPIKKGVPWFSDPFYSHFGGFKLQFEIQFVGMKFTFYNTTCTYKYRYNILAKFPPSGVLQITLQMTGGVTHTKVQKVVFGDKSSEFFEFETRSDNTKLRVTEIVVL